MPEGLPRFVRDAAETGQPAQPAEAGEQPPSAPAGASAEAGSRKDLRQRLKDFLGRVRRRLDERSEQETPDDAQGKLPAGEQTPAGEKAAAPPSEAKARPPDGLFSYLEELAHYLPEQEKASFLHSDARLKIEYIKSKLQGNEGIKKRIETSYRPPAQGSPLDPARIADAFTFMRGLASYHPDKNLGTMLQSRLNGVLRKLRGRGTGG